MGVLKPPTLGIPVLVEPTLMCRALVGLADIDVVGVIGWTTPMQVHIASTHPCPACGTAARVKQTLRRRLGDLLSFGRPVATVWRQRRWRCPDAGCPVRWSAGTAAPWRTVRMPTGRRDSKGQVADAWSATEAVREIYRVGDPDLAHDWVAELAATLYDLQPRDPTARPDAEALGTTDRGRAHLTREQRPSRGRQQPGEAGQAGRVRDHRLDPLARPGAALRRPARLAQARHHHPGRPAYFRRTVKRTSGYVRTGAARRPPIVTAMAPNVG